MTQQENGTAFSQAKELIDSITAVNLDEVVNDEIVVPFREWVVVEEKGRKRRKSEIRQARIMKFVSMKNFNRMIKAQQDMRAKGTPPTGPETMRWMTEQVLHVWKESEEDMTLEKLEEGLEGTMIMRLFFDFFGAMLNAVPSIRAASGGATPAN
jgi:hypothetical protein